MEPALSSAGSQVNDSRTVGSHLRRRCNPTLEAGVAFHRRRRASHSSCLKPQFSHSGRAVIDA
jgi:hypothetical protein